MSSSEPSDSRGLPSCEPSFDPLPLDADAVPSAAAVGATLVGSGVLTTPGICSTPTPSGEKAGLPSRPDGTRPTPIACAFESIAASWSSACA